MASHVSSKQRLTYLRYALESIAAQETPPDAIVLSWYADEPLATEVLETLRAIRLPMRVRCLRQPRRLSQYCHLREALAAFELEAPRDAAGVAATWLLFCDDDDLWHPMRTRFARLACAEAGAEPPVVGATADAPAQPAVRALAFGVYAYPVEAAAQEVRTPAQVNRSLDARHAGIWLGASEVFQYAVRPALLRTFLRQESDAVLNHRFADVRFATWMRQVHKGAVRECGADELVRLDRGAKAWPQGAASAARAAARARAAKQSGAPPQPTEPHAEAWLVKHWLYFYRNQRQVTAAEWIGDLDDMRSYHEEQGKARAAKAREGVASGEGSYERASTGRQPRAEADRAAARRVLARLGPARSKAAARREEEELIGELGRLRHNVEITVMMCFGFRNAEELAMTIVLQSDPGQAGGGGAAGSPPDTLQAALVDEQRTMLRAMLAHFGHAERRRELPKGTVEECLA